MFLTDQEERNRQILAAEMFLTLPPHTIKQWLNQQEDRDYKNDMRNRFNQLNEFIKQQAKPLWSTSHD